MEETLNLIEKLIQMDDLKKDTLAQLKTEQNRQLDEIKEKLMKIPEYMKWLQTKGSLINGSIR